MKKRILCTAIASLMALSMTACGQEKAAETAAPSAEETAAEAEESKAEETAAEPESPSAEGEGGTFIVGFDQDFPPMGFVGDDGEFTGFDLALAEETAKRLGLTFTPQPIAWDSKDMELESGNIDCIWNGFTMTGRGQSRIGRIRRCLWWQRIPAFQARRIWRARLWRCRLILQRRRRLKRRLI